MMSLLIQLFIKNKEDVSNPNVKKAYAALSSTVAISEDGFNNLSDAGTNLVSLLDFKIVRYGGGSTHPFGHGRIEWIMGIFTSIAVLLMGIKLAETSVNAITNPQEQIFSAAVSKVNRILSKEVYRYFKFTL